MSGIFTISAFGSHCIRTLGGSIFLTTQAELETCCCTPPPTEGYWAVCYRMSFGSGCADNCQESVEIIFGDRPDEQECNDLAGYWHEWFIIGDEPFATYDAATAWVAAHPEACAC